MIHKRQRIINMPTMPGRPIPARKLIENSNTLAAFSLAKHLTCARQNLCNFVPSFVDEPLGLLFELIEVQLANRGALIGMNPQPVEQRIGRAAKLPTKRRVLEQQRQSGGEINRFQLAGCRLGEI